MTAVKVVVGNAHGRALGAVGAATGNGATGNGAMGNSATGNSATGNGATGNGQTLTLDDSMLLGQGGEARVYRHPSLPGMALKVFHEIEPHLPPAERARRERMAALRVEKLALLTRMTPALPAGVIAPVDVLTDGRGGRARGDVVGYVMPLVDKAEDIAILAMKKNKAGRFDQRAVLELFRTLGATIDEVHKRGVIVGDMNDGNVVLAGSTTPVIPRLIDVDSMQIGALPCAVAHERFLDPRLYGVSLVDAAAFDVAADLYSLRVLLFQSLLCVHPYGGVHPKLPTLLRRAEARWSVLRGDVQLPRASIASATLSDDLLHDFSQCFDKGERTPIDERLFATRFVVCSCGVEHARTSCPACATFVQAPAIRTSGGVREDTVVDTRGIVLHARMLAGGIVGYLIEEDGRVLRETKDVVLDGARPAGLQLAIAGDATWIGHESQLVKIVAGTIVDRALTSTRKGAPVFATSASGLFVLEGDALVHHETRARVGRLIEGQTALLASDDGGLAMFRAGRLLIGYRFTATSFVDAALPQPAGKLVDVQASFGDSGACLVGFACDHDGKRMHTLALLDARGHLVASAQGEPHEAPHLEAIGGKLLVRDKILSASSEGVVAIDVDRAGKRLHTGSKFEDTRHFVDASVELLAGSAGSLVVVAPQSITRLRLSGRATTT